MSSGQDILALVAKLTTVLEGENASPAAGNTALLFALILSMQITRPDLSAEEVANFLHRQILSMAEKLKQELAE